jgi:hypothetical protein
LFGATAKNLAPGDEKTLSVQLQNSSPDPVVFYLKATALTAERAEELANDDEYELDAVFDAARYDALLSKISIVVTHNGETLYNGTLGGSAAVGTNAMYSAVYGVPLGLVSAGNLANISVWLKVGDLGNGFQKLLTGVEWVFVADQRTPGFPTPTPSESPSPGETAPPEEVDIADDDAPLAELDDGKLADIGDDDVPLDKLPDIIVVPKTGDDGGALTYGTVAGAALAGMIALFLADLRRRKKS